MIHDKTLWRDRDVAAMAKVRVGLSLLKRVVGRAQWIGKEVHDFIYGEEEIPSLIVSIVVRSTPFGVGILKDAFDPNFESPNVNCDNLIEMGIKDKEDMD
ncbi:hypothetical protein N7471_007471 [Penicillium samsonianum]|uniref:uncharacterized protein n=1 Tax=Penicillium samsonianum TaxID=1882272 RepID=UPI002546C278|nr:uncharacterized protein N7471_007471 [Penicillium samsonianum]KAJ6132256.1 hypothetical protein N7471_007471 [Penicillium samsonianum]